MRILIVEDSRMLLGYLALGLRREGFAVDTASTGEEALYLLAEDAYDVVILDRMLPETSGDDVLRAIRKEGKDSGVLILSARDEIQDRVDGLEMGADDYLVKPFAFEELLARVRTLIRRRYASSTAEISIGDLTIHLNRKEVFKGEAQINLPPREYALLEYLALRRGQVVSRSEIEKHIYDERVEPMSNVVDTAVYALRRKIDGPPGRSFIQTRRGFGYILDAPP